MIKLGMLSTSTNFLATLGLTMTVSSGNSINVNLLTDAFLDYVESASDTNIISTINSLDKPSEAALGNSSCQMSFEERTFTFFPKLPMELRLKIWKHTLPGTRLIHFHTGCSQVVGKAAEYCTKANSAFAFVLACQESLWCFQSSYEKLPLVYLTDGEGKTPFFFIDFNIDIVTIYYNLSNETAVSVLQCLTKVRHLAITTSQFSNLFRVSQKLWSDIRNNSPSLTRLSFVHSWSIGLLGSTDKRLDNWRLIDLPSVYSDPVTLPPNAYTDSNADTDSSTDTDSSGDVDSILDADSGSDADSSTDTELGRLMACDVGSLKFLCANGQKWTTKFRTYMEQHEEWSDISVEVCLRARRATGCLHWDLEYWVEEPAPMADSVEEDEEDYDDLDGYHWHTEPVVITSDTVVSCQASVAGYLCQECGEKRWTSEKDAFWLEGV